MNLIPRWLARRPQPAAPRALAPVATERDGTRRELLSMAVRDTLRKHGIPVEWITAETSPVVTARRERGIHLRLVLRQWQPALPGYAVAIQQAVTARLARLDPLSCDWLAGVSWKFEPADAALCPALPDPGYWRAAAPARLAAAAKPERTAPAAAAAKAERSAADPREALKRLLARADDDFAGKRGGQDGFAATQPGFSHTLPMLPSGQ